MMSMPGPNEENHRRGTREAKRDPHDRTHICRSAFTVAVQNDAPERRSGPYVSTHIAAPRARRSEAGVLIAVRTECPFGSGPALAEQASRQSLNVSGGRGRQRGDGAAGTPPAADASAVCRAARSTGGAALIAATRAARRSAASDSAAKGYSV
jgi:hypothetical protein